MNDIQMDLSDYLDITHTFPVEIDPRGPLPLNKREYDNVRDLVEVGFSFTPRTLLHAIGCKAAALPMSATDECLKTAYFLVHQIELSNHPLTLTPLLDADLKPIRSQYLGIGMTCLIAQECFGIPWDQLEPIAGTTSRFDYRGSSNGTQCIFESKCTIYRGSQRSQIQHGLDKKSAHHDRGEYFDVELIISTHISENAGIPRILLADPPKDNYEEAFGPSLGAFYSLRHYSRVLQFIGDTATAREYYELAMGLRGFSETNSSRLSSSNTIGLEKIVVNGDGFVGNWYTSWIPALSKRYGHLEKYSIVPKDGLRVARIFQGIRVDYYEQLLSGRYSSIQMLSRDEMDSYRISEDGLRVSVLPDATILVFIK